MSSAGRGRGGKFNKVKRGGGKKFSRDLQPLNADGEVVGMWGEQPSKVDEESEEEEESSEEESSDEDGKPAQEEMTREQRREAAKKRKAAAIAKKSQKTPEAGDLPTDSSEEEDDMPANPNHTAKARSQASTIPVAKDAEPAAATAKGKGKQQDLSQLSRREREAIQAQQAKERYEKLHAEGKTEQARADLERLALVRERRDAEAARKKAEAEERAELEKEKAELMDREKRRREQAMGKAQRLAKGGKKK
ncbi:hypothetical protein N0V83_008480 [Neocucurbitaria cava]|uniref:Casein kinase substrate phosphoprotein PP28 domain-containing protein n=1 Tax=Neocucurbitaria cava TaxID=798079 RepID=A0A9W9CJS9_9PLEO|nr:hypothetical protein N0V83_008480 [Neocucurbitaria cava]